MNSEMFSQYERNSAHNVGNKSKQRRLLSTTRVVKLEIMSVCSMNGSGDIIKNVQNLDFQFYKILAFFGGYFFFAKLLNIFSIHLLFLAFGNQKIHSVLIFCHF